MTFVCQIYCGFVKMAVAAITDTSSCGIAMGGIWLQSLQPECEDLSRLRRFCRKAMAIRNAIVKGMLHE
ncbi:MAG: hypothetical protein CL693_15830 [Cellvibrionaceae bacterium]|nr:hypothetical protein [Cellvibrionaceae bacterium]|tara:strand:+ start:5864 stop:6070 length:207 start_codon:yes stop_codon:yes gene_type:complete